MCLCANSGPLRRHVREEADPDRSMGGYSGRRQTECGIETGRLQRTNKRYHEEVLSKVA